MLNDPVPERRGRLSDADWFLQHFDEVVGQYEGEWVGIKDHRVVVHDADPAAFGRKARELGVQGLFITRAHPDAWRSYKLSF